MVQFVRNCTIPEPPECILNTTTLFDPIPPTIDQPLPEFPTSVVTELLPCNDKDRFPCPNLTIDNSEKLNTCKFPSNMSFQLSNSAIDLAYYKNWEGSVSVDVDIESYCCDDTRKTKDEIVITPTVTVDLPTIKIPCSTIKFEDTLIPNKPNGVSLNFDVSVTPNTCSEIVITPSLTIPEAQCVDLRFNPPTTGSGSLPGIVDLSMESVPDPYDCYKIDINSNLLFSTPKLIKNIKWKQLGSGGCLTRKILVLELSSLILNNNLLSFDEDDVIELPLEDFIPIQEEELCKNKTYAPQTADIPFATEFNAYLVNKDDGPYLEIVLYRKLLKFCCGRFIGTAYATPDIAWIKWPYTKGYVINIDPSDPSILNPSILNPSTSDPSTSDPSTSDPSTSDPSTSDPSTSDPSTSDPSYE